MHAYAREAINQKAVVMARRSDLTPRLRRRASASMFISLETRHLVWGSNIFTSVFCFYFSLKISVGKLVGLSFFFHKIITKKG